VGIRRAVKEGVFSRVRMLGVVRAERGRGRLTKRSGGAGEKGVGAAMHAHQVKAKDRHAGRAQIVLEHRQCAGACVRAASQ